MGRKGNKMGQHRKELAELELPEGYTPPKSSKPHHRGGRNKKAEASSTTATTMMETVVRDVPSAPAHRRAHGLLNDKAAELGIDMNPPRMVSLLTFNTKRTWRSMDNSASFLKKYEEFQHAKLEPKLLATKVMSQCSSKEVDFIRWYEQCSFLLYKHQGRLAQFNAINKARNWPHAFGITTKAPLIRASASEHKFVEDTSNRQLPIYKAFAVVEVGNLILQHVSANGFMGLASLSQTCNAVFDLIGKHIEHWDITAPGDCLGNEVVVSSDDGKVKRSPVALIVSPIRKDMSPQDRIRPDPNYGDGYETMTKLFRGLANRSGSLTNLQLHRVQFLDVTAVRCILRSMESLENLGIYQCPLLHLGTMEAILDTIRLNPKSVADGQEYVHLDFFPMFHQGPNTLLRHGSYGVTWNNPGCDSTAAIMKLVLYNLYPKSKEVGVDILEWGCAFRLFLEKCPMPASAVVRVYEAIKTFEYTGRQGRKLEWKNYSLNDAKFVKLADELTAAIRGDGEEPSTVSSKALSPHLGDGHHTAVRRKFGWWRDLKRCMACSTDLLALFYPFGEGTCWGCILEDRLCGEWDHHKTFKAKACKEWFGGCGTLDDIVKPGASDEGYMIALEMDRFRHLENTYKHGSDEQDWPEHPNFSDLARRHARYYERHGPLDRKLNEKQYHPVGYYGTAVTTSMVPKCWPEKDDRYGPIARQNDRDRELVQINSARLSSRSALPNRVAMSWDEIVCDMLHSSDLRDKNGRPMKDPRRVTVVSPPEWEY